jgi:HK97 family phage portal protein
MLNLTRSLYLEGNAYAVAIRNSRFEIDELHLMHPRQSYPMVAETGEIFYALGGNEIIERRLTGMGNSVLNVPARDVLHVKLHTPWHPLRGESPIRAAYPEIATSQAMTGQQFAFYNNQARPSYVLGTDAKLTREQAQQLREAWNDQSRGMNAGNTPILSSGLKPMPLSIAPEDAQLAEMMKLTDQRVAQIFRIPLALLGLSGGGSGGSGAAAATESLMNGWVSRGLGFALNHIEEAFGQLFQLKGQPDEYVEFNTSSLLRSSMKDRIAALAQGVQGGIYSPNEAREIEELPSVKAGDEPRVQQQVVPLSAADAIPAAPAPKPAPPAGGQPAPTDVAPAGKKDFDLERTVSRFRASYNSISNAAA